MSILYGLVFDLFQIIQELTQATKTFLDVIIGDRIGQTEALRSAAVSTRNDHDVILFDQDRCRICCRFDLLSLVLFDERIGEINKVIERSLRLNKLDILHLAQKIAHQIAASLK